MTQPLKIGDTVFYLKQDYSDNTYSLESHTVTDLTTTVSRDSKGVETELSQTAILDNGTHYSPYYHFADKQSAIAKTVKYLESDIVYYNECIATNQAEIARVAKDLDQLKALAAE